MHEMGIAESIAKIVSKQLVTENVTTRVLKITLKAGRLNAIVPDSLQFHFDVIKKDFPQLHDAALEIEQTPVVVFCPSCDADSELDEPIFACPKCSGPVSVKSGKELSLDSFEVDD